MGAPYSSVQGVAGTRFPSHQLSNGLYVSGHPDQQKEKEATMGVSQMPYTGGDVKKSGELGKMFDIPVEGSNAVKCRKSGTIASILKSSSHGASSSQSGPLPFSGSSQISAAAHGSLNSSRSWKEAPKPNTQASKSGPLIGMTSVGTQQSSNSGPLTRSLGCDHTGPGGFKTTQGTLSARVDGTCSLSGSTLPNSSGSLAPSLPTTGLITSGPICVSRMSSRGVCRTSLSGPLDAHRVSGKPIIGSGACGPPVNDLSHDQEYSFRKSFPKVVLWTVVPLFVMGFIAGAFIIAAVQNAVLLIVVAALFVTVVMLLIWNTWCGRTSVLDFLAKYPDSELSSAKDGQYVKITGVVTCGSVPLESSYHKVNRCMYTSTGLYEYRNLFSKTANENHCWLTWGIRHMERHVVDFYISDLQTGLRALVKAGYGARITPYVEESVVVDVTPELRELPSDFQRWLTERELSSDARTMKLKEGCIKEGSTVTVFGVVQRHENILMIIPPTEVVSTGCKWTKCLLPANINGIILRCSEAMRNEGIPL